MAGISCFVVGDLHFSVIVHPELAHYNVVHRCGDFAPGVVVAGGKFQVSDVDRIHRKVFATKFTGHGEFSPAHPIPAFTVLSKHWRMVADLNTRERVNCA